MFVLESHGCLFFRFGFGLFLERVKYSLRLSKSLVVCSEGSRMVGVGFILTNSTRHGFISVHCTFPATNCAMFSGFT